MKVFIQDTTNDEGEAKGKLYIESDQYQYIIKEYTTSKDGKEYANTLGYYSTLRGAINKLVDMKLRESTATTLGQLVEDMKRAREYIESITAV